MSADYFRIQDNKSNLGLNRDNHFNHDSYICFKLLALSIDDGLAVFSLRPVEMLS